MLTRLVAARDALALDLYLLLLALIAMPPFTVPIDTDLFVATLGIGGDHGAQALSKALKRLESYRLIDRRRTPQGLIVDVLQEDGSGLAYTRPGAPEAPEPYVKLPFEYWLEGWNQKLSLPAKAILLIALTHRDYFPLPLRKAKDWYGLSAPTAQKGLRELIDLGLLELDKRVKRAPNSPNGYTRNFQYRIAPHWRRRFAQPAA